MLDAIGDENRAIGVLEKKQERENNDACESMTISFCFENDEGECDDDDCHCDDCCHCHCDDDDDDGSLMMAHERHGFDLIYEKKAPFTNKCK
jgi:hypothetical protein